MTDENPLYLEDLSTGMKFCSGKHRIDAAQIKAFAAQFDPQPFHLDEAAAAESFFHGLAASGWHTMAITMKLIVGSMRFPFGVIGAGAELSWPTPTRPGDVLRVEAVITDIKPSRSRPDRAMVMLQSFTLNDENAIRLDFRPKVLVFSRGASPAEP